SVRGQRLALVPQLISGSRRITATDQHLTISVPPHFKNRSVSDSTGAIWSSIAFTKANRSHSSFGDNVCAIVLPLPSRGRLVTSSSVCAEPSWKYGADRLKPNSEGELNPAAPKAAKPCVLCPATAAAPRISSGPAALNVPTSSRNLRVPFSR